MMENEKCSKPPTSYSSWIFKQCYNMSYRMLYNVIYIYIYICIQWLVVLTILKNVKVTWKYYSQYMEKEKNVPNHQPNFDT